MILVLELGISQSVNQPVFQDLAIPRRMDVLINQKRHPAVGIGHRAVPFLVALLVTTVGVTTLLRVPLVPFRFFRRLRLIINTWLIVYISLPTEIDQIKPGSVLRERNSLIIVLIPLIHPVSVTQEKKNNGHYQRDNQPFDRSL